VKIRSTGPSFPVTASADAYDFSPMIISGLRTLCFSMPRVPCSLESPISDEPIRRFGPLCVSPPGYTPGPHDRYPIRPQPYLLSGFRDPSVQPLVLWTPEIPMAKCRYAKYPAHARVDFSTPCHLVGISRLLMLQKSCP
jgi:hypothetical protein